MKGRCKDLCEAGEDPDERLLDVVHSGEEVNCLAQLMRIRLLHQLLENRIKQGFLSFCSVFSHKPWFFVMAMKQ
jgi:hypothetical protein